jgi:hypothetical protein
MIPLWMGVFVASAHRLAAAFLANGLFLHWRRLADIVIACSRRFDEEPARQQ